MNINDIMNQLNSIESEEQRLNEQISQLESDRLSREQSQLRMVGQEPSPVPKSEEQIRLEQEKNNLVVNKNRLTNIIASYRQIQTIAANSEYSGYSIQDFEQMRESYDSKRKELAEKIQTMETERVTKEQSQLRMVGQEPSPVPKSEEQVRLEKEKLVAEQGFQKIVNIINIYNRTKEELNKLNEEKDLNKSLSEYSSIIYKINRAGLPEQLIENLMENKIENKNNLQEEIKETPQSIAEEKQLEPDVNQTPKQPVVQETTSLTREQEIYKLLEESSKRLRDALVNGDDNAVAQERGYRGQLLNELNAIKEEENRKIKEAEIAKYESLLQASNDRLQKATNENNEAAIAQERSYRQQVLNKIAEIKGIQLEEPKKVVSAKVEEPTPVENNDELEPEVVSKETIEEPVVEAEYDDYEQLNDEQIREKIKEIETKRKEIDGKIIKIDLNAPWEESSELMREFIILGKEKEKLQNLLPTKLESDSEEPIIEEIKEEVEEIKPVDIKEDESEKEVVKEEIKEEKKKIKRKPRFRKFLKKIIPSWMIRAGFAIKRAFSKVLNSNIDDTIDISDDVEADNSIGDDEVFVDEDAEEDLEKTIDFSSNELNVNQEENNPEQSLEQMKDILEQYRDNIEETLNDSKKTGRKLA